MKYKVIYIILVVLIGLSNEFRLNAQNTNFSQYYASELYLSPCFAAKETHPTIGLNTRTQWLNVGSPYQSSQLSLIYPIYYKKKRISNIAGVGVSMYKDEAGQAGIETSGFTFSLAYNQPLSNNDLHHLYFGMQFGLLQRRLNLGNIQTGNQFDPNIGFNENINSGVNEMALSVSDAEMAAGLSYYFNPDKNYKLSDYSIAFGVGAYHLNQVNLSLLSDEGEIYHTLYNSFGSITFHMSPRVYLKPNFMISSQANNVFYIAGAYANVLVLDKHTTIVPHKVSIGGYYRQDDAFVPVLGIGNDYYNLGFSYDWSTSLGREVSMNVNTYEISLQIEFYHPDKDESLVVQPRYRR